MRCCWSVGVEWWTDRLTAVWSRSTMAGTTSRKRQFQVDWCFIILGEGYYLTIALFHHCVIPLSCYLTIALFHHRVIRPSRYSTITLFNHCVIPPSRYSTIMLFNHCVIPPLCYSTIALFHNCNILINLNWKHTHQWDQEWTTQQLTKQQIKEKNNGAIELRIDYKSLKQSSEEINPTKLIMIALKRETSLETGKFTTFGILQTL